MKRSSFFRFFLANTFSPICLAWPLYWLAAIVCIALGYSAAGTYLFLTVALLALRPIFQVAVGEMHGRYRSRKKAQAIRADTRARLTRAREGADADASTQGAPARVVSDFYGDYPLTMGSIYGMRAWHSWAGTLHALHQRTSAPWLPGENVAQCYAHHEVPYEHCGCGFYAYTLSSHVSAGVHLRGVIEGYGRVLIGTKGFRCEKARIVAFLRPRFQPGEVKLLREHYPDVPIYRSKWAMLRAFPLGDD